MTTFQRARNEEQREIRRQAILDTAVAMLDDMPVAEISLNELSRRSGLAKSNVLRYFESREAILLEVLDRSSKRWLAALADELAAGVQRRRSVRGRTEQVAAVIANSLAREGTLCDLLSAQAGILEHNVSAEVAARYKAAAFADLDRLAALLRQHLPELGDRAEQLCLAAVIVTGAVWTHAHPSEGVRAAYEADTSLAARRIDFAEALHEILATLILGTLARAT